MDDYWTSTGHTHHIDLDAIKSLCFQLLCIFETSTALAHRYDISPDGGRFLMLKPATTETTDGEGSPELIFVQNWFDELQRLVPTDR